MQLRSVNLEWLDDGVAVPKAAQCVERGCSRRLELVMQTSNIRGFVMGW
jgi:hypothetical protein